MTTRDGQLRAGMAAVATAILLGCLCLCASAAATGDASASSCRPETEASPGFRGFMADCRAYELVSPAFGAGAIASGVKNQAPPMSPEGENLLAVSFGAFAGTEELKQEGSEEFGEIYQFSRTPLGWVAEPQDPPANLYPFHAVQVWSGEDLGRSIWKVPSPVGAGEEPELYWFRRNVGEYVLREGRERFVPIGPLVAPGHEVSGGLGPSFIEGASVDLEHIAFSVADGDKQLWPGDGTVEGRSLYEYRGTAGGEPVLVGVRNEGAAPWQAGAAHLNEGAQLISECGTEYDGMSADGDQVLFTAHNQEGCTGIQPEASELYARVDGSRTVPISRPSRVDCATCDTSETAVPAVFTGASAEGDRVFFATEAKLFAGVKGETGTNLYEYDFEGPFGDRVKLVAPDVTPITPGGFGQEERVADVAKDGTRVYFQATVELVGPQVNNQNGNGETAEGALKAGAAVLLYVYDSESGVESFVGGARVAVEPPPYFSGIEPEPFKSLDMTADGEFLAFETATDLRGTGDTSTVPQVFEYDAVKGTVTRVSRGQRAPGGFECPSTGTVQEGYDCDGNTGVGEDAPRIVQHAVNSVSEAGTVVFTSELPLTPGAVQGRRYYNEENTLQETSENVYEYRAGQVYLTSSGDEPLPPHFSDPQTQTRLFGIDESGRNIFFASVDPLVPQDTDTQSSWYDAREEGGFPAPAISLKCKGEECQGGVPGAPALSSPGSAPGVGSVNASSGGVTAKEIVLPAKSAAAIKAEKLRSALRACRRLKVGKRHRCEVSARVKFGPKTKKKKG
jgi:hypothetical protein